MTDPQNFVTSAELDCTEETRVKILTKEPETLKHGWLLPYIEQDLTKSLRSSEKVELWLRAHFSHQIKQPTNYVQNNEGLQYGERTNAAESVLTSLAALGISSGIFSAIQEDDSSKVKL